MFNFQYTKTDALQRQIGGILPITELKENTNDKIATKRKTGSKCSADNNSF